MRLASLLLAKGISLEGALDSVTDAIILVDSEDQVIYCNKALIKITGSPPPPPLQKSWRPLAGAIYPNGRRIPFGELPISQALAGRTIEDMRVILRDRSLKEDLHLSCSSRPIWRDQTLAGAILILRDITSSVGQEKKIHRDRAFFEQILNALPAMIHSKDVTGRLLYANEKFLKLYPNPNIEDSSPKNVYEIRALTKAKEYDKLVMAKKQSFEFEDEFRNENDDPLYFQTIRFPIFDEKGEVYALAGLSFDITEKVLERKIRDEERMKLESTSKMASLGLMAAEIAHEINNPLAIIKTTSQVMKRLLSGNDVPRELLLERLEDIDGTVNRILEIVNALRNVSRDSSCEDISQHSLREIFYDVNALVGTKLKTKDVRLFLNLEDELFDEKISCSRIQLSEVLINLIGNAIDAIEEQKERWIRIELSRLSEALLIKVKDSGPGVPSNLEEKIFEPFFSTKELGVGTGLGLSISKNILMKFGGDLYLEDSAPPRNTFVVKLPLLPRRK